MSRLYGFDLFLVCNVPIEGREDAQLPSKLPYLKLAAAAKLRPQPPAKNASQLPMACQPLLWGARRRQTICLLHAFVNLRKAL